MKNVDLDMINKRCYNKKNVRSLPRPHVYPNIKVRSADHMGRVKQPCCIGSADSNSLKPICEQCGLGCYSVL
ncbi:MAG TPA: hypothetical protein VEL11_06000, partial [Candidatus Bathyarchaeia archaeon]|nr:hypothetical protein [Candidatus Bathyarchaeia archaeon]